MDGDMSDQAAGRSLGKRLRKLRTSLGMSQKDLGAPLCTHAYVSEIESGKRTPSERVLRHFADKLGVDAQELITGRPGDLIEQLDLQTQEARRVLSSGALQAAHSTYERVLEALGAPQPVVPRAALLYRCSCTVKSAVK